MKKKDKDRIIENNKHIPTHEIERDIADTQSEILVMKREIKGFRILGDRWSMMRADGRESGIEKRRDFIRKLKIILEDRKLRAN